MKKMKKSLMGIGMILIMTATVFAAGQRDATPDNWPTRPVQIVVPFNAGGDTDFYARLYARFLTEHLGQQFIVSNMPGGSGTVGSMFVRDARPDGYTVLVYHESLLINQVAGVSPFSHTSFDTGAALVYDDTNLIVTHRDSPLRTLDDVVRAARANPGSIAFGSNFGMSNFLARWFERDQNIRFNIVDAGGAAEANAALLARRLDLNTNPSGSMMPFVHSGDFHIIAVLSQERNPNIQAPTAVEQGYNWLAGRYYFILFPQGTPRVIIDRMAEAVRTVANNPTLTSEMRTAYNTTPRFLNPEQLRQRLDSQLEEFAKERDLLQ
jgi:tripartite-type tricarboxylate transporter receptor subunit TctC